MLRITTICALALLAAPALGQSPADRPTLKAGVTISSDIVRIGDLVEHAGDMAQVAIFRSPDLGHTGAVPIASVFAALRPYGLDGADAHGLTEVVVTRSSRSVTVKEIESSVVRALSGHRGLAKPEDLILRIDQTLRTLHLESSATGPLEVARLSYDPRRRRFDIVFDLPGSAILKRTPLHLSGTVIETTEIAIPARPIQRGETVKRSDLILDRRPRSEIASDALLHIDAAIGLAARRNLRAGEPLRPTDLMKPELVQRNDTVTLVYEAPGMLLTVRGKALEAGAAGDAVSVVNLQSKRTVHGTVSGPGRITVFVPVTRIASAAPSTAPVSAQGAKRPPSE
jgi:flagella basal body P-ring formation protein FlgA